MRGVTPPLPIIVWCSLKKITGTTLPLTYLLTSWCRILFEKLIVTQLVKKYPAFLWSPKVHHRVHIFETFRNNNKFYSEGLQPHVQPPSWRTTPCRLSATAYSIYSHLLSVPGGLPSIRNMRTRHVVVTREPPNMDFTSNHLSIILPYIPERWKLFFPLIYTDQQFCAHFWSFMCVNMFLRFQPPSLNHPFVNKYVAKYSDLRRIS
jgi:hypothetical protein